MNSPILLLDMDLILTDFNRHTVNKFNEEYGTSFNPNDYNLYLTSFYSVHESFNRDKLENIFRKEFFFSSIPVIEGAEKAVEILSKKFDTYIVTKPMSGSVYCYNEKMNWVDRYFPYLSHKVVMTGCKYLVQGNILVDDHPHNVQDWTPYNPFGTRATLEYPWSTKDTWDIIEPTWKKLAENLMNLYFGEDNEI